MINGPRPSLALPILYEGTLSPDILVMHHVLQYTHHLGKVVGRGNQGGDVDHLRWSWSCRNPPIEEVLQKSSEFQGFHTDCGISQF